MSEGSGYTFEARLEALRAAKLRETQEKQALIGAMDHDDWGVILPPPEAREVVETVSPSGMPIRDVRLKGFMPRPNHPSGGFFGAKAAGANFRALLDAHPPYVDPNSSLAGAYMANFSSYRKPPWNPDLDPGELREGQRRYQLSAGIGAMQHFCQDLAIGLEFGWAGLLAKIRRYRPEHLEADELYDGLEDVALGIQSWIGRTAQAARQMAAAEEREAVRANLEAVAAMNECLASEPPATFREACQWILWYDMAARMYNGSGSLGRLDVLLTPFYERDVRAGILTDEGATFHVACLLLRDPAYLQLGGPDASGRDVTNRVSYLVLEAAHRLKIPANVGVCVGESTDAGLLKRGAEILLQDKTGMPKFLGIDNTARGFARNGFPISLGYERAYSGCHWSAIPGREYTVNDCVKVSFGRVFEVAFQEMMADGAGVPSTAELWRRFESHVGRAVEIITASLAYHLEHMHQVFPELVLDLLCHGPIEKGLDASHGGLEYYNLCLDGCALATVADSFAALEQRVEREGRFTWEEMARLLESDWAGPEGERARLLMRGIARYGSGGSRADDYAVQIARTFTRLVTETPTPGHFRMMPGLFSWANTISMGRTLGATPNGRRAGEPISHGANPDPGFRKDGAPTAMAVAIAGVQPGRGNTAPMQIELDPSLARGPEGAGIVAGLIKAHFDLGGTQINMNVVDREKLLQAHEDPSRYPDLIVRVTGFSAYFASLSPQFRQLVIDRMLA